MSDALILAVVAMVCVTVGGPIVLSMHLGRRAAGRATRDGFELSTGPDERGPTNAA
jgi:hypothetical protein